MKSDSSVFSKRTLSRWCMCAALVALAAPGTALAQSTGPVSPGATTADEAPLVSQEDSLQNHDAAERRLDDIVVVARRKEGNVQEVPASIGVVAPAELQARAITSFQDIKGAVANLATVQTSTAGGGYLSIRGQTGLSTPNIGLDSQVGIYLDGVYLGRAQSSGGDISDIARLEVLRGPQGTLFGRNSTAGAVNFITGAPTGKFGADGVFSYGNYDRKFGRLTLNSPNLGGFSFRFSYQHEDYEGDIQNAAAGTVLPYGAGFKSITVPRDFGSRNSEALIAKARYDGIRGVTIDYKYDYSITRYSPSSIQVFGFNSTTSGASGASLFLVQAPGAVPLDMTRKVFTLNQDGQGLATLQTEGQLVNVAIAIGSHNTVKSISSYRTTDSEGALDLDGGVFRRPISATVSIPLGLLHAENLIHQKQWSQEAQLIGDYGTFNYILGFFYFHEKAAQDQLQGSLPLTVDSTGTIPIPASGINQRDRTDNTSYAGYAHGEYKIFDPLEVAVGVRYTWDKKQTTDSRGATPVTGGISDSRLTYDGSLTYKVARDINLYARYAYGYVAGGFARSIAYAAETTTSHEGGVKSELFDRRLRLNAAVFHTDTSNLQRAIFVPGTGVAFFNIGSSRITGFELESTVRPVRGLTLTGNLGYVHSSNSDGSLQVTPNTNAALSAQYDTVPLFSRTYLSFRVDADYRGKYYASNLNTTATRAVAAPLPAAIYAAYGSQAAYQTALLNSLDGGDYWLANGRVSLMNIPIGGGSARLTGYVKNIFNERGKVFVIDYGLVEGATFERERTYGIELGLTF